MSAPKQLAKRQKLERKRRRKRELRLIRRKNQQPGWLQPAGLGSIGMVTGPVGGLKMSTVFEEFVSPLLDSVDGRAECKKLFSIAQVAWNAALEPESRRDAMLDDMIKTAMPMASLEARQGCRELLDSLVARKLESFAKYQRPIFSFQLDELEDGGYYLSVASGVFR